MAGVEFNLKNALQTNEAIMIAVSILIGIALIASIYFYCNKNKTKGKRGKSAATPIRRSKRIAKHKDQKYH
jgi:hypothetical protein